MNVPLKVPLFADEYANHTLTFNGIGHCISVGEPEGL